MRFRALRASGKPVWTWPSVIAVDAGPMQIQLGEGRVWRCAEAVLQGTTRDLCDLTGTIIRTIIQGLREC